ncbi:MAG: hypothetical protein ACFKPT_05840 [Gloeotrichia echinulata GP01]
MPTFNLEQTITAWSSIAENVFAPHTEEEYEHLVEILDCLIDQVGEDETHPLASLMEVIGVLIENYETEHIPELDAMSDDTVDSQSEYEGTELFGTSYA